MVLGRFDKVIDITELTNTSPEVSEADPGRPFDPETEIDPKAVDLFKAAFEVKNQPGNENILIDPAINFKRLFPDKINELDLERIWSYCQTELKEIDIKLPPLMILCKIKELFPDRFAEALQVFKELGCDREQLKQAFLENVKGSFNGGTLTNHVFIWACYYTKIVFPEVDIPKELGKSNLEMEEYLLKYSQEIRENKITRTPRDFLDFFIESRIAFSPGALGKIDLTPADWNHLRSRMNNARDTGSMNEYIILAGEMKIAAAQSVKVTDHGIEVIMPGKQSSLADSTPNFPTERTF
jgi:hypothetical protein